MTRLDYETEIITLYVYIGNHLFKYMSLCKLVRSIIMISIIINDNLKLEKGDCLKVIVKIMSHLCTNDNWRDNLR